MNTISLPLEDTKPTLDYSLAKVVADRVVSRFYEACIREPLIVGSVRRGESRVGDIEILFQPHLVYDMFGVKTNKSSLFDSFFDSFVKDTNSEIILNGERLKKLLVNPSSLIIAPGYDFLDRILLEFYLVIPPSNWGVLEMIRTGPKEFSKWIVTQKNKGGALPSNCFVKDGQIFFKDTEEIERPVLVPSEQAYFDLLGLDFIAPQFRRPDWNNEIYSYKKPKLLLAS